MTDAQHDRKQRMYPNTARVMNHIIEHGPVTIKEMSEALHLCYESVLAATDNLRRMGVIYVKDYRRSVRGDPSKLWVAGSGTDAKKPKPYTTAEKSRKWRSNGGDAHYARNSRRELERQGRIIAKSMTLAGQLLP